MGITAEEPRQSDFPMMPSVAAEGDPTKAMTSNVVAEHDPTKAIMSSEAPEHDQAKVS